MAIDTVNYTEPGSGAAISFDSCGASGLVQLGKLAISELGSATLIPADATYGLDVDVTRSVPVLDATGTDSLDMTTPGDSATFQVDGRSVVFVEIGGTWSGTISFHSGITTDAYPTFAVRQGYAEPVLSTVSSGLMAIPCAGLKFVKLTAVGVGTGTATLNFRTGTGEYAYPFVSTNLQRVDNTDVDVGPGNYGLGTQRVIIATDQTEFTTPLPANIKQWNGVAPTAAVALADNLANPTAPPIGAYSLLWDGTQWLRQPAPKIITLLASAARTTGQALAVQTNPGYRGVSVTVTCTAASGTGGLTVRIQETTPIAIAAGQTTMLLQATAAITATGAYVYRIHPGAEGATIPAGSNLKQVAGHQLPPNWRVVIGVGDASSYTYSVEASLLN